MEQVLILGLNLIGYCECPETHTSPADADLFVEDIQWH
jgi:hypothetical protein